jgi:hypothetical protein
MTTFLSTADANVLLNGIQVVGSKVTVRRQGNGRFTGSIVTTYADGTQGVRDFIQNARSIEDVRAAYLAQAAA